MHTASCDDWIIERGSVEWRHFTVTGDVTLDAQPVAVSVDWQQTWHDAEWVGGPGETREGRVFLAHGEFLQNRNPVPVFIRVIDAPEVIIIPAGNAYVR